MTSPLERASVVGAAPPPDLESYRIQARAWLSGNLELRDRAAEELEIDHFTPDVMTSNRALQRRLFEGGYAGISWPREFGGQGLTKSHEEAFFQEASNFVMPEFGLLSDTTFDTCVPTMLKHASPDFLKRFIPKVMGGDALVCQFFSEPSAGSDLAAVRTKATRANDGWVIRGQKLWSSWAQLADWGMCLARTDWDAPKHRGLTWFTVPCNATGLTIRPIAQITGETDFCEEFFDDVLVSDDDRIGAVGDGWTIAQTMLVYERGAGRRADAGGLSGPGPLAPDLMALVGQAGRLSDPIAQQLVAQVHINDYVGRALMSRIDQLNRMGRLTPGTAAYGKLFAGVYNPIRARIALTLGGPEAVAWDADSSSDGGTAWAYLNGRRMSIAGGTNEMQRNAIAERALGMPREPTSDRDRPFSESLRDADRWRTTP